MLPFIVLISLTFIVNQSCLDFDDIEYNKLLVNIIVVYAFKLVYKCAWIQFKDENIHKKATFTVFCKMPGNHKLLLHLFHQITNDRALCCYFITC